jgi:TonB family protein
MHERVMNRRNAIFALFLSIVGHVFLLRLVGKRSVETGPVDEGIRIQMAFPTVPVSPVSTRAKARGRSPSAFAPTRASAEKTAVPRSVRDDRESPSARTAIPSGDGKGQDRGEDMYSVLQTQGSLLTSNGYVKPVYPLQAIRKRQEGRLQVRIEVEEGRLLKSELVLSSGFPHLDDAALQAIEKWQFRALSLVYVQEIRFKLE